MIKKNRKPEDNVSDAKDALIKKVEAYEEYGYGQRYDNKGSISLTRREPFQYDPREFEIIPYFKGLVPQITNIY